jgi:hypothetical protein
MHGGYNVANFRYTLLHHHTSNGTFDALYAGKRTTFLFCEDNHNSVNGIQCFARRRGAKVRQVLLDRDLHMDAVALQQQLRGRCRSGARQLPGLLAYPAQSNVSGVKHSLGEGPICHEEIFSSSSSSFIANFSFISISIFIIVTIISYLYSNSIQFNSIQFNSIQFNSIQFNSIQFNSIQFNSIQFNSIHSAYLLSVTFQCLA